MREVIQTSKKTNRARFYARPSSETNAYCKIRDKYFFVGEDLVSSRTQLIQLKNKLYEVYHENLPMREFLDNTRSNSIAFDIHHGTDGV